MAITLTPGAATLAQLRNIWETGAPVTLDRASRPAIEAAAALVAKPAVAVAAATRPIATRRVMFKSFMVFLPSLKTRGIFSP